MEALLLIFLLVGVVAFLVNQDDAPTAAAPAAPSQPAAQALSYVTSVEVDVSHPSELNAAIEQVVRQKTNNLFSENFVVGTPQVTADGLHASVRSYQ